MICDVVETNEVTIYINKQEDDVEFTFPKTFLKKSLVNIHVNAGGLKFTVLVERPFNADWTFPVKNNKVILPYHKCAISRSKLPREYLVRAHHIRLIQNGYVNEDIVIPLSEL